jgi:thiamine-phosphate pyrophosphorylase
MIRCMITDRRLAGGESALVELIARRIGEGVNMVQIREKDLEAGDLLRLVERILRIPGPGGTKIIVNSRLDVALAAAAHGVHLPAGSPPPSRLREITPAGFLIGVSCHDSKELSAAEREGADYAVFGPVFSPLSKRYPTGVHGLDGLRAAASEVKIPVLALGGITTENTDACIDAGAAGIAAISLFL